MATGRLPDPNSAPVTAKGDLYTYSTVPAKLAVGSNGETLVADSSATTSLRWQAPVNPNPVLNSAFQIWQRGTSIAGSASAYLYTADRWQTEASTAITVSRQTTSDTTNLPFIQYCARAQRNNASTATATVMLSQSIETINSIPYAGKTITFSFYARRGANFSGASNQINAAVVVGTGTDQNAYVGGFTGASNLIAQTPTLTTTWQRFTYTATVATTTTQLAIQFYYTPTGTAGAADFYEVTGVQLEVGSVATPFKTYAATLAGELAACQRYYYRFNGSSGSNYLATGYANSGTVAYGIVWHPNTMRGTPSFSAAAAANFAAFGSGGATATAVSGSNLNTDTFVFNHTQASGLTTGGGLIFYAGSAGYFELSAEL